MTPFQAYLICYALGIIATALLVGGVWGQHRYAQGVRDEHARHRPQVRTRSLEDLA